MTFSRLVLPQAKAALATSAHNLSSKLHPNRLIPNHPLLSLVNSHLVGPISDCRTHPSKPHFLFCTSAKDGKIATSSETPPVTAGLRRELMPGHVALILDGNKRWAELRGLGPEAGHDAGLHALLGVMGLCAKWGIKVATFFLFSSENWRRPKDEIDFVMWRFQRMLVDELQNFIRQGIRISTIGNTALLSNSLQQVLEHTKEATKDNAKTQVIFAISYSGQDDITQACQRVAEKVRGGIIEPKDITVSLIEQELETRITSAPRPDLLIRTSGELRISNFLLWQLAYSELYFTKTLWPDFGESEFTEALRSFQQRRRRFGGR